jgi:outer membrane protein, heavy metal efflux system
MRTSAALRFALMSIAAGCAAVNPRAGLDDIERLVTQRGSLAVAWPADADAAKELDDTVGELLAKELTAESATRIALLNNRNLQALYRELGVAEAELVQAGLLPNPVLSANVRFGLGPSGTGTELGLVQDLISALQIPLRKRIAGADLEIAKLEVADAVLNLALDTKASFYRLQGALQMLELRRTVAAATALALDVAQRQHAAGNTTDLDRATEQALSEEAKVELAIAEGAVLGDREELNTLLGVWGDRTVWTVAPRLARPPEVDVEATGLESLAVSQRLDLEAARMRTLGALAQYRLGRFYGIVPAASLGTKAEREVGGGWSIGPALDLPIPLFDQRQAQLAGSAARVHANEERHAALAIRIRADVRRARTRLEAARARAQYSERVILPLQARIVEQTQREYNAMVIGVFQLLQAKRDEIAAGQRYIETLTEYWVSRTELERAVGGELRLAATPATTVAPALPAASGGSSEHQRHHHGG